MTATGYSMRSGTAAIVAACLMFGGIYFLTPFMAPLGGLEVWAFRIAISVPIVALILVVMRQIDQFTEIWHRLKRRPALIFGVIATGLLVSVQLWLFSWAPLNGRGLSVALGYFLLPLVLVLVGRFVYRDKLEWWHWLAAGVAAAGVAIELLNVGTFGWEPLVVCLGYPMYFVLRRSLGTASTGGMLWEFLVVLPIALWLMFIEPDIGLAFSANPHLWWFAPVFGLLAAVALWLYVLSSKLLPISIFGLMSYLEPALLAVAAILIGERIMPHEYALYGAIWAAVLILLIGGMSGLHRDLRRDPRR